MADYQDDFNRSDGRYLGFLWAESKNVIDAFNIWSNQLRMDDLHPLPSSTHGFAYWTGDVGNDQFSELRYSGHVDFLTGGVAVRIDPGGSYDSASMYAAIAFATFPYETANLIKLIKFVNESLTAGHGTVLGEYSVGVSLQVGDRLRISAIGDQVTVFKNDVAIIGPVTDTTLGVGKPGVVKFASFSNSLATVYWDNWRGGPRPDGSVIVLPTYGDDFNRNDPWWTNTLQGDWLEYEPFYSSLIIGISDLDHFGVVHKLSMASAGLAAVPVPGAFAIHVVSQFADQFSEITFSGRVPGDHVGELQGGGPAVRIDHLGWEGDATLYVADYMPGISEVRLRKYVRQPLIPSSGTVLGSWPGQFAPGDKLRLEAHLNTLTVLKNGLVIIGPVSDASISSGMLGFCCPRSLVAQQKTYTYWDDWTGGSYLREVIDLPVEAGAPKKETWLSLKADIRASMDFSHVPVDLRGGLVGFFNTRVEVDARFIPDKIGPTVKRFPYPRDGQQNFPVDAPIVFFIRDGKAGVDIDTVFAEIDGVKYRKGDPEFTFHQWNGPQEYLVAVKPLEPLPYDKEIKLLIYGLDLRGNPGVTLELV